MTGAVPLGPAPAPGPAHRRRALPGWPWRWTATEGTAPAPPVPSLAGAAPGDRPAATAASSPQAAVPGRQGDLAQTSVPRLLVALHQAQATGALTLTRGRR